MKLSKRNTSRTALLLSVMATAVLAFQNCSDFKSLEPTSKASASNNENEPVKDSVSFTMDASEAQVLTTQAVASAGPITPEGAALIRQLAIDYLGRDPSSITPEYAALHWGHFLTSGKSANEIALIFYASDEARERVRLWQEDMWGRPFTLEQVKKSHCGSYNDRNSPYPTIPCTLQHWRRQIVLHPYTAETIRTAAIRYLGRDGNTLTAEAAAKFWRISLEAGATMRALVDSFKVSYEGRMFNAAVRSERFDWNQYTLHNMDVIIAPRSGMTSEEWAKVHWFRYGQFQNREPFATCEILNTFSSRVLPNQFITFIGNYARNPDPTIKAYWIGTNKTQATNQVEVAIEPQPIEITEYSRSDEALRSGNDYVQMRGMMISGTYQHVAASGIGRYTRKLQFRRGNTVLCTSNQVTVDFLGQ